MSQTGMTVVSRGTKRKNGHLVKVAQVIFRGQTYHVHFDPRTELWHPSPKRSDAPTFNFAP